MTGAHARSTMRLTSEEPGSGVEVSAASRQEGEGRRRDQAARRPLAWVIWWGVGAGLAGSWVAFAPASGEGSVVFRWMLEPWLVGGLLLWTLGVMPLRAMLGRTRAVLVGTLLAGALLAQFAPGGAVAYPLTQWSMYTAPEESVRYAHFEMLDASGRELGHLPVADVVPSASGRAYMDGLAQRMARAEDGDQDAARTLRVTLDALLDSTDDPEVVGVEARWCAVEAPTRDRPARCRSVLTVTR